MTNNNNWKEKLMDEFCVMFKRATIPTDGTIWENMLERFISSLLASKGQEIMEELDKQSEHQDFCDHRGVCICEREKLFTIKVSEAQKIIREKLM